MRETEKINLLQIIAQSEGAMAVYDTLDLRIAFVNHAMLHIWGRDESIVGDTFGGAFPEFTEQGFTDILKNVWQSGQTYRGSEYPVEITIGGVTELKYFDFTYQAILDEQGQTDAIVHIATDVTFRRSVAQTVAEQDVVIHFNNELEILTRTLSHDVNNPLSLAKMGLQHLNKHDDLTPEAKKRCISLVLEALSNVEDIISHTVQVNQARLSQYSGESHDMEEMLSKICLESQLLYEETTKCVFETGALDPLYGDKEVLYHIFLNVVGNAVKFSSKNDKPSVWIESKQVGLFTVYTIRDKGIGIPQKDLPHIFNQFFRSSNAQEYPGTGIGLCLVQKIMVRIQGDIKISSTPDNGTVVELYFPNSKNGQIKCK